MPHPYRENLFQRERKQEPEKPSEKRMVLVFMWLLSVPCPSCGVCMIVFSWGIKNNAPPLLIALCVLGVMAISSLAYVAIRDELKKTIRT